MGHSYDWPAFTADVNTEEAILHSDVIEDGSRRKGGEQYFHATTQGGSKTLITAKVTSIRPVVEDENGKDTRADFLRSSTELRVPVSVYRDAGNTDLQYSGDAIAELTLKYPEGASEAQVNALRKKFISALHGLESASVAREEPGGHLAAGFPYPYGK